MGQSTQISYALVVVDREKSRQIASTLIEESGFRVIEAEDVEQAMELLEIHGRKLGFVFAELNGSRAARELTAHIKRRWPSIRVLVSYAQDPAHDSGLPSGASRLRKPWAPLDLLIETERALH